MFLASFWYFVCRFNVYDVLETKIALEKEQSVSCSVHTKIEAKREHSALVVGKIEA